MTRSIIVNDKEPVDSLWWNRELSKASDIILISIGLSFLFTLGISPDDLFASFVRLICTLLAPFRATESKFAMVGRLYLSSKHSDLTPNRLLASLLRSNSKFAIIFSSAKWITVAPCQKIVTLSRRLI